MNLMTAGRGIAHSERTPDIERSSGQSHARPAKLDRAARRRTRRSRPRSSTSRPRRCRSSRTPALCARDHRRLGVRQDLAGGDGIAMVLCRGRCRSRAPRCRSIPTTRSARSISSDGEIEIAGDHHSRPAPADLPPRRPHHRAGAVRLPDDVSRRRRAGRPAPHLVEFRLVQPRAHRAGQTGLENRPVCRCAERERVHSAAGMTTMMASVRSTPPPGGACLEAV